MSELSYLEGAGPSLGQAFKITGHSLIAGVDLSASEHFEISLYSDSSFHSSLLLPKQEDSIDTTVYVRLKSGLQAGNYTGELSLSSKGADNRKVSLKAEVKTDWRYDFTNDIPATSASTPPAQSISIGSENGATAGVVSYRFNEAEDNNCFTVYSV